MPESEKLIQRKIKELLGREFRMVKKGLDPDEVIAYLDTIAGSSEAALKRLENFSSLQKLSRSMEAVIAETSQLAEQIKAQSKLEAETEKHQVIEEAKHQVEEMLEQTRERCIASIESTNSVFSEAITKARQNMEAIQQDFRNIVEATSQVQAVDTSSDAEVQETAPAKEPVFDSANPQASGTPDCILETQPADFQTKEEKEPDNVEAPATALKESNSRLYSGEITLVIPHGVSQSWMQQLRQRLLNIPGVYIRMETGSDTGGTMMTLSLNEPIALPSLLLETQNVKNVIETQSGQESSVPKNLQRPTLTIALGEDTIDSPLHSD